MPDTYSVDDLFGASVNYDLDDLFAPSVYSVDDLFGAAKKKKDEKRYKIDLEEETLGGFFEQMGRGFAEQASLGLTKGLYEDEEPAGTWESLARGIGSFGGFLTTPIKGAKLLTGIGGKAIRKVAGKGGVEAVSKLLLKKTFAGGAARVAKHLGAGAMHLGTAEAISDIQDVGGMPERFAHGAKIGALYGLAGMSHIFKTAGVEHVWKGKVMNLALSQIAGRGLLAAAGEWNPTVFADKKALPEAIFHEALNTFFLSKGIHPLNILTGDMRPWQSKILAEHDAWVKKARKYSKAKEGIDIPREVFHQEVGTELDIQLSMEGLSKRLDTKEVERHLKAMKDNPENWQDIWGKKGGVPRVRWNDDLGKYEVIENAELLQSLREFDYWRESVGLDRIDKAPVKIISSPYEAVYATAGEGKVPTIPTSVDVAMKALKKDFLSAEAVAEIEGTKDFAFNLKTGELRVINRSRKGEGGRLKPNELLYQINKDGELKNTKAHKNLTTKFYNSAGKPKKDKYVSDQIQRGKNAIDRFKQAPLSPLPVGVDAWLKPQLDKLGMFITDMQKFYEAMGMGKGRRPKMFQLGMIEDRLYQLSKTPQYLRMPLLMQEFSSANNAILFNHDTHGWGDSTSPMDLWADKKAVAGMKEKQLRDDVYFQQQNFDRIQRLKRASAKGETGGSLLANLVKVGWGKRWLNIGKLFQHWTISTGLPFWEIGRQLKTGRRNVDKILNVLVEPLVKYKRIFDIPEQTQMMEYWERKYERKDIAEIWDKMSGKQKEFIGEVDKILSKVRPNIGFYRIKNWLRLKKDGQTFDVTKWQELISAGKKKKAAKEASKKLFKNEERPEVQEILHEAMNLMATSSGLGVRPEDALLKYVTHGRGGKLGVVEEGSYLPRILLGRKPGAVGDGILLEEYARHVDTMSKKSMQSRGEIKGNWTEGRLENAAFVLDSQPLVQRVNSYLRQILNLTYLEPSLKTLDSLVSLFADDFKQIKGIRGGFDFMQSLRLYAHRKKGLPVQMGGIGAALKGIQALFFRVLTASNPYLWLRNIFQRKVTVPHKEVVFDPRYMGKTYKHNIPEHIKQKFEVDVTQMHAVEYHYLFTEEASKAEKIPVLGWLYKLAKPVGKMYSTTDLWNRRSVFTNTYLRGSDYINKYLEGKIDADYLEARLGLAKFDPLERKLIRFKIAQGDVEGAAFEMGMWMSDNSQWIYERSEKSLHEMTAEGEAWTNLITWSKGIIQSVRDGAQRMHEGIQTGNDKKIMAGAQWMGSTMIAGQVANQILKNISNKHGNKYNDYGLDMFFWEMGGVSGAIARDFTEALADFATSVDEPEDVRNQAIAKLAKFADNTMIRQLVPFMKWAFSAVESITGTSYIQPVQQIFLKKGLQKVDRTIAEGFTHALLTTDPTKSPQVRKWTHIQAVKYRSLANRTKSPPLRAWYEYRANKYENLANMFDRYQPIEVFEAYRRKELEKWEKQFTEEAYLEELAREKMSLAEDRRKREMGYID